MISLNLTEEQAGLVQGVLAALAQHRLESLAVKPQTPAVTLESGVAAVLAAKAAANLRARYITSLRQYLAMFIKGREALPIGNITAGDLESWFAGRNEAPVTRASNLGRLSALFGYALRRGWISDNPCKRLERVRMDQKTPETFTPDQARALLKATPKNCLAFVVLGLFAGVRPEELLSIEWSDIDLERGLLTITTSKTRRRRQIRLEPVAVAWLKTIEVKERKIAPSLITIKRMRIKLRSVVTWHQDVMRHTAGSYLMALYKDAGRVSTLLGNSPAILIKHYVDLVSDEDCKAFWELTPDKV